VSVGEAWRTRRPPQVAVVGAGSWGTAFARHLVSCGVPTTLLARRAKLAEAMRKRRRNPEYVDFLELPSELRYGCYLDDSLAGVELLVLAVPSRVFLETATMLAPRLSSGVGVLSLTKGLEPRSRLRLSEVLRMELAALSPSIAVLSGPNQAEEVALGQPTATVIASDDAEFGRYLQELVTNESLRAYVNDDLVGVELAAAVKNVVALATGMSDGLGYGDNARAALVTRGLAEIARLGAAMGADPLTFAGLAGLGDLVGTCTSRHSRNRLAGELIAQGHPVGRVEEEMGMVAEGLTATPVTLGLARDRGVDMPIAENVAAVVLEGKDVRTSVHELMSRQPRAETH